MDPALCYRNKNGKESSDSDDSSDSDAECDVWKRSSRKSPASSVSPDKASRPAPSSFSSDPSPKKRKVNNIWSNIVIEEDVSSTLKSVGIHKLPENAFDRSCENYDFTRKELDTRPYPEDEDRMDADEGVNKDKKRWNSNRSSGHKDVRLSRQDAAIAKRICWKLGEQKQFLIYRTVGILGSKKAVELLKMTEDIEDAGGMLIKNGNRRRSPGGVYFQLVKNDASVTKEQLDKIFIENADFAEFVKQSRERRKERKKLGLPTKPRHKGKSGSKKKKRSRKMDTTPSATSSAVENQSLTEVAEKTPEKGSNESASSTDNLHEEESLEVDPAPNISQQAEENMKCEDLNVESDIEDGEILD